MEILKNVGGKMLRCGYTTGSCATAATKAALAMLLSGDRISEVLIHTPAGIDVTAEILNTTVKPCSVKCAVRKDSGDDPDATRDMLVYSEVTLCNEGVHIKGGEGIGKVTKPGLDQPVGEYAINSTPRQMINQVVQEVSEKFHYTGGVTVELSIPGGEMVALKTFNPRMGIVGGLSVIGTSGIVEPMSNKALEGTVAALIKQLAAKGCKSILLTPGNYGKDFASEDLGLDMSFNVNCSNFIGESIDTCVEQGFDQILIVGHIGKMVKLGIGSTNTHSAMGDGRIECLIRCALQGGASLDTLKRIDQVTTTDGALEILREEGLCENTMDILGEKIMDTLRRRVPENVEIGYICFTKAEGYRGILCRSENAFSLIPYRTPGKTE